MYNFDTTSNSKTCSDQEAQKYLFKPDPSRPNAASSEYKPQPKNILSEPNHH